MASSPASQPPAKPANKSRRRGKKEAEGNLNVTPGAVESGPASPVDDPASENGVQATSEAGGAKEKEYLREVAKRLKKQTKKLENIKKSEDKIKDLPEEEKATSRLINQDERKKIADKPTTLAVHKELQEIHDKLQELSEAEARTERLLEEKLARQKREFDEKLANAVKEAREEGLQQGRQDKVSGNQDKVLTLIKFLRLAGYRRSVKSDNPVDDDAIEKVLVLVYSGDNVAMEACSKLDAASEDKVEDLDNVSYGRIKQLAYELKLDDELEPEEAAEEAAEEVTNVVAEESSAPTGAESTEEVQSYQVQIEQQQDAVPPPQAMTEIEQSSTLPATSVTAGDAANDAAKEAEVESPSNDYVVVEKSEGQPQEVHTNGLISSTPEPPKTAENKDGDFTKVAEHRRGRGGRGGYRGRGDGSHRGPHRGRGGHRGEGGERGEHRGRGGHRGPRGDGHRGGHRGGRGDKAQQPQQQPQAIPT